MFYCSNFLQKRFGSAFFSILEGDPDNKVKAVVSFLGGKDSSHKSNGNHTGFSRTFWLNGDTTIQILGGIGKLGTYSARNIRIFLRNVSVGDTYALRIDSGAKKNAFCYYDIGDLFGQGDEMYNSHEARQPGSVTIDVLTPTSIQGTFTPNCSKVGDFNRVEIKNGTFKETFSP